MFLSPSSVGKGLRPHSTSTTNDISRTHISSLLCTHAARFSVAAVVFLVDSRLPFLATTRILPLREDIDQFSHWRLLQNHLGGFDEERWRFGFQICSKLPGIPRQESHRVRLVEYLHHLIRRPQGLLDCVLDDDAVFWFVHQSLVRLQQPAVDAVEAVRLHGTVEVENTGLLEQPSQEQRVRHWFACVVEMGVGGEVSRREAMSFAVVESWDLCCCGFRQCAECCGCWSSTRRGVGKGALCRNGGEGWGNV
jgi:hypothetical protein